MKGANRIQSTPVCKDAHRKTLISRTWSVVLVHVWKLFTPQSKAVWYRPCYNGDGRLAADVAGVAVFIVSLPFASHFYAAYWC
jgi:hypothetical protein